MPPRPTTKAELSLLRQMKAAKDAGDTQGLTQATQQLGMIREMGPGSGPANLDVETGAPFGTRAAASVPVSAQGRQNILESRLGEIGRTPGTGAEFFTSPETGRPTMVNPIGPDVGDIASAAGPAIEVGGALAGGALTGGSSLGVGGGVGIGNLARQFLGNMLGASQPPSLPEAAAAGGTAFLGEGALRAGTKGFDAMRPSNFFKRQVRAQEGFNPATGQIEPSRAPQFTRRGRTLEERIGQGFQFSISERTGSRVAQYLEGLARRSGASAQQVATQDVAKLRRTMSFLDESLKRLAPNQTLTGASAAEQVGGRLGLAVTNAKNALVRARSEQGKSDFGAIGRSTRIPTIETRKAFEELIEENASISGGDTVEAVRKQLQRASEAYGGALDPKVFQRELEIWGKRAGGKGGAFMDVTKAPMQHQQQMALRVKLALERDLDAAAASVSGDSAQLLKVARDNWKAGSRAIEEVQDSAIAAVLGRTQTGERISESVLKMKPSEVRHTMRIIADDPDTISLLQREVIEELLEKSKGAQTANIEALTRPGPPQQVTRLPEQLLSARKFATALQDNADLLKALFEPQGRRTLADLKVAYETALRLGDKALEGSVTAFAQGAMRGAKLIFGGLVNRSPSQMAEGFAEIVVPKNMARLLVEPAGRAALLELSRTGPKTRAFESALVQLGIVLGRGQPEETAAEEQQ